MLSLDLSIEFVSATTETASQTGDPFPLIWILWIISLALFGGIGFYLYKKINSKPNFLFINDCYKNKNAKYLSSTCSLSEQRFKIIGTIFAVILAIALIVIFSTRNVFASPTGGADLTPDTDKIIASIHDDGSITFSTCHLKNTSGKLMTLETATVKVADEAQSVVAIHSCELTINSFDGCVYKGKPDGQGRQVAGCSSLDVDESTIFALELTNLDKQSALALCGKKVFTLNLQPEESTIYNLETDGNGSWIENGVEINSFEVPGIVDAPAKGETITYTGLDRELHIVTATPNSLYVFSECLYYSSSKTYTAKFAWETYDITYLDQGGGTFTGQHEEPHPTKHGYGSVTELKGASKTGYTFGGWHFNQDCSDSKVTEISADTRKTVTLYAKWTVNQYTLTFKDGETVLTTIKQDYGSIVTAPENPSKTGYTFTSWDKTIPATMPAEDMTFLAQWAVHKHTVTFNANGRGTAPAAYTDISYGSTFNNPGTITGVEGYTHDGKWYKEAGCTNEWNFTTDTMPDNDLTLYAKWVCIVEFDMNDHGTQVPSQSISIGGTVSKPNPDPSEGDYEFAGWYTSDEFKDQNPYDFNTQVTSSFTLHARWKGAAKIHFEDVENYDGSLAGKGWVDIRSDWGVVYKYFDLGTPFTDVLGEWNNPSEYNKVTAITKTGYDFDNFDIDDPQKTQEKITDDETLWFNSWTPQTYNIEYYDQGGGVYTGDDKDLLTYTHTYGKETTLKLGDKDGYTFEGWYDNMDCTGTKITILGATSYTSNITLYAKWTKKILKYKATVIKGEGEKINATEMSGQGWKEDASGNWYKEFPKGFSYQTILSEWGNTSSWSTATSITKEGMILTGFNPSSGELLQDTEFRAQWRANTEYNLTTDGNGVWKEESQKEVTSITVAPGESVPTKGETIKYKGTDGMQHEVKATPASVLTNFISY